MEQTSISNRVQNLLDSFHAARPEVFAERAVLVTQAYAETEGQPMLLRHDRRLSWNFAASPGIEK